MVLGGVLVCLVARPGRARAEAEPGQVLTIGEVMPVRLDAHGRSFSQQVADQLTALGAEFEQRLPQRAGHDRVPHAGRFAGAGGRVARGRQGLIDGHHDAGRIERAGRDQRLPLLHLALPRRPGRRHHDHLCTPAGQGLELLGEAQVIAGGQADADPVNLDQDEIVPRLDLLGFAVAVGIEQVQLVVCLLYTSDAADE